MQRRPETIYGLLVPSLLSRDVVLFIRGDVASPERVAFFRSCILLRLPRTSRSAVSMSRSKPATSQRVAFSQSAIRHPSPLTPGRSCPQERGRSARPPERGLYEPQQGRTFRTVCIFPEPHLTPIASDSRGSRSAVSMSRSKPAVSQRAAFSQDAHCIPIASHFRGPWSTRTGARSLGAAASRQSPNALHFLRTLIALRSPRTSADLGPRGSERGLYEPQQAGNLPACRIFPERHPTPIASYSRALLSPRTGPLRTSPDRGLYEPQHAGNLPACRIFPQRHPTPIASDSRALLFPRTWPAHPPPERGLYEPQQGRTFPTVCIYRSFVPSLRRNACRSAK